VADVPPGAETVSFEAVNYPNQYIRHTFFLGVLTPVSSASDQAGALVQADATFIVHRPGLGNDNDKLAPHNGNQDLVSFEAVNYPGYFLRHQDFRVKLQRNDGTSQFRQDATFVQRPSRAGNLNRPNPDGRESPGIDWPGTVSYEAVSFPGYFIRHQNFELWVAPSDAGNRERYPQDTSFFPWRGLSVAPGQCTRFFHQWRAGHDDDYLLSRCQQIMGINQYCAARDAFPAIDYYGDRPTRYLKCAPYSHPDGAVEQIDHIIRGVSEGLSDAYVAAAPFLGLIVSGVACSNGVVYACAALVLDIVDQAGVPGAGVAADAVQSASQIEGCVDGKVTACAQIGARGARLVGVNIPGKDPAKVADDAQKCNQGDFAACVRLGQAAGDAGGVPVGLGPVEGGNARDCLNGNSQACASMARDAVQAGIPLGGVAQGSANAGRCAGGDNNACIQLGRAMADAAR
jgi:hypothetical protein